MKRWLKRGRWCGVWISCVACGGSPAEPATPESPSAAEASEPADSPSLSESSAADEPTTRDAGTAPDGEAAATRGAAGEEQLASPPEQRNVVYRVSPGGLVVEVDGTRFKPTATAKKLGGGAYGIDLTVLAEAIDDRTHTLLSPQAGPLSIAATIFDKHGKEHARYGDTRDGEDQEFLMPGGTLTLTRSWPSGSVKGPLWWGQTVRLEVGLWGLGAEQDAGRPVRKLFVVEMVGGNKPQAVVSPPEL